LLEIIKNGGIDMKKLECLELECIKKDYDMACHNLMCYSKNLLMEEPKKGFETDFKLAKLRVEMIENTMKKYKEGDKHEVV
jgi:hypothetical protein